jgi:hypothetical protein
MCAIKVPIDILNQVDKYRIHCLWRGGDVIAKKPPLAVRRLVTKLKSRGGLGVIRLRLQNESLLMKNLHKFFNRVDLPWVKMLWTKYYLNGKVPYDKMKGSFWWKNILKLLPIYKGIVQTKFGIGDTILFWTDMWNDRVLKQE